MFFCMFLLHVLASCSCFMFLLHVLASCSCCMFLLHVLAACSCFMFLLHVLASCSCCCCRFTKNLSPDKINLSALKGEGDLSDLELDEAVLMELLALPTWLRLSKAFCNRVTIKVSIELQSFKTGSPSDVNCSLMLTLTGSPSR